MTDMMHLDYAMPFLSSFAPQSTLGLPYCSTSGPWLVMWGAVQGFARRLFGAWHVPR